MFIVERLSHAERRGAKIYAEIAACKALAEAHHVTGLDADSDSLAYLITQTVRKAGLRPEDIGYINAHGTGTLAERPGRDAGHSPGPGRRGGSGLCQLHQVDAGPHDQRRRQRRVGDHGAGDAGRLRPADAESDRSGPGMHVRLPAPGRTPQSLPARPEAVRGVRRPLVAIALSRWNDPRSGFGYPAEAEAKVA